MNFKTPALLLLSLLWSCLCLANGNYGPVYKEIGFHPNGGYFDAGFEATVNHFGGNLLVSNTDVAIAGNGLFPLSFSRTHNSNNTYDALAGVAYLNHDSPLGLGWTSHYGFLLIGTGQPQWQDNSGARELFYRHDALDGQIPINGEQEWISKSLKILVKDVGSNTYTLYTPEGLKYQLESTTNTSIFKPKNVFDVHGNRWTFTYEADSDSQYYSLEPGPEIYHHPLVKTITDDWGRRLTFSYNIVSNKKRLNSISLNGKIFATYNYRTLFNGVKLLESHTTGANRTTHYLYNEDQIAGRGATTIRQITSDMGGAATFSYQRKDFRYEQGIVTPVYAVTQHTYGGGTWDYQYNDLTKSQLIQVTVDGPDSYQATFNYHTYGNNLCTNDFWKIGQLASSTETYNQSTFVRTLSYQTGGFTVSNEAIVGTCSTSKVKVPLLSLETQTIDGTSLNTSISYNTANDFTFPTTVTSPGVEHTTSYRHLVTNGRYMLGQPVLKQQFANGDLVAKTQWIYGSDVNPSSIRLYKNQTNYDAVNFTYYTSTGKKGTLRTKNVGNKAAETYDYQYGVLNSIDFPAPAPNMSRIINQEGTVQRETSNGVTRTFSYDNDFRLTSVSQPDANTDIVYTSNTVTKTQGNASLVETYDSWGRLASSQERVQNSPSVVNAITSFSYNAMDDMIGQTLPSGVNYIMSWDIHKRIKEKRATNIPQTRVWQYATSSNGETTSTMTLNNGMETVVTKDAIGRMTFGSLNGNSIDYSYDGTHLTISPQNQSSRTINFDFLGRKTSETHPETGTTSYSYDQAGWNTAINKPGLSYTITHDSLGQINQVKIGNEVVIDNDYETNYGALSQVSHKGVVVRYSDFDSSGRPQMISTEIPKALPGVAKSWPLGTHTHTELNNRPRFEWTGVTGADKYGVEVRLGALVLEGSTTNASTTLSFTAVDSFSPQAGNSYEWRVRAQKNDSEIGPWSPWASFTVEQAGSVPTPPTGVNASDNDVTIPAQIRITFNSVSGADTYKVYRATSSSGSKTPITGNITTLSVLDSNVSAGTTYYYWVTARNAVGESAFGNYDTGTAYTAPTKPDLVIQNIVIPTTAEPYQFFPLTFDIKNNGTAAATMTSYKIWLSSDGVLDESSDFAARSARLISTLDAGQIKPITTSIQVPGTRFDGPTTLFIKADYANEVDELNESNNVSGRSINIIIPQFPDLRIFDVDIDQDGTVISRIDLNIHNGGYVDAPFINWRAWWSHDRILSADDQLLTSCDDNAPLPPETSRHCVKNGPFNIPAEYAGPVWLIIKADYNDEIVELPGGEDNLTTYGFTTGPRKPTGVSASNNDMSIPGKIRVSWQAVNHATSYKVYRALSANGTKTLITSVNDPTVHYLDDSVSNNVTYYYWVTAVNYLGESDFSNHDSGIAGSALPDITVQNIQAPASAYIWQFITLNFDLHNGGDAESPNNSYKIWLSTNSTLEKNTDSARASSRLLAAIPAGQSSSHQRNIQIPPSGFIGQVYIIVEADYDNEITESQENNNVASRAITIYDAPSASRNDGNYPNYQLGDAVSLTISTNPIQANQTVYSWRKKDGTWQYQAKDLGTTDANGQFTVELDLPTDATNLCGSYSNEQYAVGSSSGPKSTAMAYTISCP